MMGSARKHRLGVVELDLGSVTNCPLARIHSARHGFSYLRPRHVYRNARQRLLIGPHPEPKVIVGRFPAMDSSSRSDAEDPGRSGRARDDRYPIEQFRRTVDKASRPICDLEPRLCEQRRRSIRRDAACLQDSLLGALRRVLKPRGPCSRGNCPKARSQRNLSQKGVAPMTTPREFPELNR